jgi:hypothetical protein
MSVKISEILARYRNQKTAGEQVAPVESKETVAIKTAAEAGMQDAENLMKVAAVMGDVISERIIANLNDFFGSDAEKTASLQELVAEALIKAADAVTGTAGNKEIAADQAEALQIDETAVHHATLAAQAATDAVTSLAGGDEQTATQQMATAASALETAKSMGARSKNPAVHEHINAASSIVAQAAGAAGAGE